MKRIFALMAALAFAAPANATSWSYQGEKRKWEWDISREKDKKLYIVVHKERGRWVSRDRLRVEFSIRARNYYSYNPYVLYDEFGRCDLGKVCDPPLYPTIDFNRPVESRNLRKGRMFLHSFTIDCKNAPRARWEPTGMLLNMKPICEAFR